MHFLNLSVLLVMLLLSMATWAENTADSSRVLAIEAGSNGSLWFLSEDKLHRISGDDRQSVSLPNPAQGMQALSLAVSVDGTVYIAGEGLGIHRSTDDGRSWKKIGKGTPGNNVNAVVAHSTLDDTVYAHSPGEGVFRSANGGDDWERVDAGPQEPILTFLHSNMKGSMETGWLFAGTERGVARSMDCFCLWSDAGELRGEVTALAYDAEAPMNVYAAVQDTLYHSADGGESWSVLPVPGAINELAVTDSQLYAATEKGLFVLKDKNRQWEKAGGLAPAESEAPLVEQGKQVYQQYCAACHGPEGKGLNAKWKKRNALGELPPPPHDDSGHTWRHSDEMLYGMIREGWRDPFNKTDKLTMPAFGQVLEQEEVEAVVEYLKTLWSDEHRAYQQRETQKK